MATRVYRDMHIKLKRVYENATKSDGMRVLVERLWPRGLTKEKAKVDWWVRDVAPSDGLRKWYGHAPGKWPEFQKRYRAELRGKKDLIRELRHKARNGRVTFVFAAKDERRNSAVVLKQVVDGRSRRSIKHK